MKRIGLVAIGGVLACLAVAGGSAAVAAGAGNTVTIDAKAQPDQAKQAMALWDKSTDQSFTATSNPTYAMSGWDTASTNTLTCPTTFKEPCTHYLDAAHTDSVGFGFGASIEGGTKLGAIGFAEMKVSVKFTAEHVWTTENKTEEHVDVTAQPGQRVWVVESHCAATFTGDYTFTVDDTVYHVNDVTIIQPAPPPGSHGDVTTGVVYMAVWTKYVPSATAKVPPSGLVPISQTPQIKTITAKMQPLKALE